MLAIECHVSGPGLDRALPQRWRRRVTETLDSEYLDFAGGDYKVILRVRTCEYGNTMALVELDCFIDAVVDGIVNEGIPELTM